MKRSLHILLLPITIVWVSCGDSQKPAEFSDPVNSEIHRSAVNADSTSSEINPDFFMKKHQSGIEFYAVGNEPFWALDMDFDKGFKLKTPEFEYNSPPVEPDLAQDSPVKRYRVETESGEMIVNVHQKRCMDTMSGQEFSHEVRVSFKWGVDSSFTEFTGCGRFVPDRALHDIWGLIEFNGVKYPNENMPGGSTLELFPEDERVLFSDGCNSFRGAFHTEGRQIHFGNMAGTLKACPDKKINPEIATGITMTDYQYDREGRELVFYSDSIAVYRWRKID